jgi:hypothetical protein
MTYSAIFGLQYILLFRINEEVNLFQPKCKIQAMTEFKP